MKKFADFLMWLGGWKLIGEPEPQMKNCVFIEAPHTSMWDFVWGRCGLWKCRAGHDLFPLRCLEKAKGAGGGYLT